MIASTRYGEYGGMYVPETLVAPLHEIEAGFLDAQKDESFMAEFHGLLKNYAGRPTPLYLAQNLSQRCGRRIYLKREDLLHGGAHKTNNTVGQGLLARRLGKNRIIAETGAGQHGVATAMIGALLSIPVEIYMGAVDVERQQQNVQRMELFGATLHIVSGGSATLKDAINDAMRDWITHAEDTYYLFGTAAGPHPFPAMVRFFQSVIGTEAREQMLQAEERLPDAVFACVGGGSNAIGIFSAFLDDERVQLFGAEAAGHGLSAGVSEPGPSGSGPSADHRDRGSSFLVRGLKATAQQKHVRSSAGSHAASLQMGTRGVFHGMHSLFLQNADGQIDDTHSIAAGLDYPGVGPEHVFLQETGRASYLGVTDEEAVRAYRLLARSEAMLGALESCHALALALREVGRFSKDAILLVNLSGRGDKDLETILSCESGLYPSAGGDESI